MKNFWRKYKEILCKSIVFAAFFVALVGVGAAAFNGRQVSGADNTQNPQNPTVTTPVRNGNYIEAAKSTDGKLIVSIDWEKQDMKLESSDKDEYFYISDAKQKTWDEIDANNGIAYCDLSWITKAYELNIRRDKDLTNIVKITIEAPRTLKAKFAIVKEQPTLNLTVTSTINKKKETKELTEAEKTTIEWRKGTTGSWQSYSTLNLDDFMTKGATLNLRLKGECNADSSKCHMPSKVGSVKITKKTNAPSVKIDASKFNLGVKKGQQYVVSVPSVPMTTPIISITDNSAAKPDLANLGTTVNSGTTTTPGTTGSTGTTTPPNTNTTVTTNVLGGDGYKTPFKAFSVKVRTAPTEKKAASKWTVLSYPEQRKVADNALIVKLEAPGKGATLQNTTTYDIEYWIPETDLVQTVDGAKFDAKTKWTTIKAGKTGKSKASAMTANTAVFFRYAAEKENTKTGQKAELASTVGIVKAQSTTTPETPTTPTTPTT